MFLHVRKCLTNKALTAYACICMYTYVHELKKEVPKVQLQFWPNQCSAALGRIASSAEDLGHQGAWNPKHLCIYKSHILTPQTPNLMSHGEGLMPSVLAFASEQNFIGQNMATSSDQLGR